MPDEPKNSPSFTPARRWKIAFDVLLRTALVVVTVAMLNYIGTQFFHRFYLSSQTSVKLSSRTVSVLHSLTNHVAVTLYYDRSDEFYPDIVALLNQYRSVNPNISVRTVDYLSDPGAAEKVKEQYNLPASSDSPNAPPSKNLIIFESGGRSIIIPGDAIVQYKLEETAPDNPKQKELQFRRKPILFNGEIMFTSKLLALENSHPFKAYFLQGDGESSLTDQGNYGYYKFGLTLAQNYIAVQNLDLTGDNSIPMDCSLLIIAAPTVPLSNHELQKIEKYLAEGGRLFVLFDFNSVNRPTGLEPILQRWGVNVLPDFVRDPKDTVTGDDVVVRKFSQHPVVNPLAELSLQIVRPRPVEAVKWQNPPANAPHVDELAFSSDFSTLENDSAAPPRSYSLMAAVEQKPVAGATNLRGNTRIIVAGDSIFLGNYYIEGGGNRDFLGYAVNWLLDRSELLTGIGPRPVTEFRLALSQLQQQQVRWLLLGAVPGAVLLFGGLVWLARRK